MNEKIFSLPDSLVAAKNEIHTERVALVCGTAAAFVAAGHIQNYDAWWKGTRSTFHFADDGVKYLHADKLGHNYFSFVMSDVVGRSFIWSGIPREQSLFYGGSLACLFQFYVEVEDGTHPNLGFSLGDAIGDITGSYFPLMQEKHPYLKNFTFKYSVIDAGNVKKGLHKTVIDDYESQYFWLSAKIPQMIFGESNFFSRFFNIAVGYSVKGIHTPYIPQREVYVALDYDVEVVPVEGTFANTVKHVLNYFHFPSPMVRITPRVIAYGLRW